jgi:AraC-like DNA-binding protein
MSQKRQVIFDRLRDKRSQIVSLAHDYPSGHVIPLHFHDRGQIVYASRGVMTVRTRDGAWVVPTHRAVWIPASVPHTITMSGTVAMRTLYLKSRVFLKVPKGCCVLNVSPLLKELILHACAFKGLRRKNPTHRHIIDLIVDQLNSIQTVPLRLPNPSDPRAVRIAQELLSHSGDPRPLSEICRKAGASKRTAERLFQKEVGMTLGKWRQQLRLLRAMQLLADGAKVTHAALEAGYSTPSAFISMFRRTLGTTPTNYFRRPHATPIHT